MAEQFTLKVRRYQPDGTAGDGGTPAPYWQEFDVDLDPTLSVLDGLLQAKDRQDGSLAVRCSCRAAICGSCGVKINGQSTLACMTQLGEASERANRATKLNGHAGNGGGGEGGGGGGGGGDRDTSGSEADEAARPIVVEPMGNMPVIKDLVTDMESVHWEKIRRVTPWLLDDGDPPERERIVEPESMVDITQTIACIQCGACVSACLSMEADPAFIGPAALAKAYRFVGDPRDVQGKARLWDLAQDPHGIYDCTHCFACVDACPKGVAPMDQIMRLRRAAGHDEDIDDVNNGRRHEAAFVKIIEKKGTLDESLLLQESYAQGTIGKLKPSMRTISGLLGSIPTAVRGIRTGKMRSLKKLIPGVHEKLPGDAQEHVQRIYGHAEGHRAELNLYITGEEDVQPEADEESGDQADRSEPESGEGGTEGAEEQSERAEEQAQPGAGGPPDDTMGGAATDATASAVGGGRQHTAQATEGVPTDRTQESDEPSTDEEPAEEESGEPSTEDEEAEEESGDQDAPGREAEEAS